MIAGDDRHRQFPPTSRRDRSAVIQRWQDFSQNGGGAATEWPLLDVFYAFIPWLAGFRDDPEGQVYLEAISRCAAEAATFSPYRGLLLREQPHHDRSVCVAVRDVLAPITEDLIDVDED
jgi:DNA helicase-2/ATP-dependent DNA helicase PcrA